MHHIVRHSAVTGLQFSRKCYCFGHCVWLRVLKIERWSIAARCSCRTHILPTLYYAELIRLKNLRFFHDILPILLSYAFKHFLLDE